MMHRLPRIFCYHTISAYPFPCNAGVETSPETFARQMELLKRKYAVLPLAEIVGALRDKKRLPRNAAAITFDDGYRDNYLNAFPVLKSLGLSATIFCAASQLQNGIWLPTSDWQGLEIEMLRKGDVAEMKAHGISFGSHGNAHSRLDQMDEPEVRRELEESRKFLREFCGGDVEYFCYPFGSFNEKVKHLAREAGYQAAFAVWNPEPDLFSLTRIPIHRRDCYWRFRFKAAFYLQLRKYLKR
jgi:peptidoglycan/xylan/chitin deacetylase (PgdA/CDA1 family)